MEDARRNIAAATAAADKARWAGDASAPSEGAREVAKGLAQGTDSARQRHGTYGW
jgi:hypothetical protein